MTTTTPLDQLHLQEILTAQRPRLLGLCTYLTSEPNSAEDLVQEVMLEAWRSYEKLRKPDVVDAWLNGIVRNVCARWQRKRGRESALLLPNEQVDSDQGTKLETVADDFDLEVELDRQEMAVLLDRAMALLPETTRDVLVSKYIAESRHAEIASQLGLTENAVTVRLHRGKVALRKLLTTELRAEAETFGIVTLGDVWTETRIWCPICGQKRLEGKLTDTEFALRCPSCSVEPNSYITGENWSGSESPFGQLKSFRPIFKRHILRAANIWGSSLEQGEHSCPSCGISSPVRLHMPDTLPPSMRRFRGIHTICNRCNTINSMALHGLAICTPEGLEFFKENSRVRMLPERAIELNGDPAIVIAFESITNAATLDVLMHRDTFTILASHHIS